MRQERPGTNCLLDFERRDDSNRIAKRTFIWRCILRPRLIGLWRFATTYSKVREKRTPRDSSTAWQRVKSPTIKVISAERSLPSASVIHARRPAGCRVGHLRARTLPRRDLRGWFGTQALAHKGVGTFPYQTRTRRGLRGQIRVWELR
jgi:hypothetical protein